MNFRGRGSLAAAGVFLSVFVLAVSVHAEEGGASGAGNATDLFKWINFAIVAGVLLWVFGKVLPPKFRNNAETISAAITKATAAKAEAERQLREAQEKLGRLEQEVAQLRATAQREIAAEAERIRKTTEGDAERIALAARAEIQAAERAARLELKAIAAKLAVDRAESLLTKQLTPATQESLVSAFVKSLEGRPN